VYPTCQFQKSFALNFRSRLHCRGGGDGSSASFELQCDMNTECRGFGQGANDAIPRRYSSKSPVCTSQIRSYGDKLGRPLSKANLAAEVLGRRVPWAKS
jgi:hypothetical protein